MGWLGINRVAFAGCRISVGAAAALATLLGACGPQLPGVISPEGYVSTSYALDVRRGHDSPAAAGLMPEGWKVDNFNGSDPKSGPAYQTTFHLDVDGDGEIDRVKTELAFELRFVHFQHAGVIWLRAMPVPNELAKRELHGLIESYVEALAGGEYEAFEFNPGRLGTIEKRFASTLLSTQPCHLGAQECEVATIELANVDQSTSV